MTTTTLLRFVRNFLTHFALLSLLFEQFAFAAELPITVDGSTNTSVDRAANNVALVNIAAPNSNGLSHNKFTDYNVNSSGLILNNAIGNSNGVVNTQIGGLINDNANLRNSGAALVILNEVTSNNVSRINGYTEIAGKKADLIIANPNGFVMNGAGFINVSKLTAVVGSSNQVNPNPSNLTFSLSQVSSDFLPALTISGAGIDLENITSTDLVANVMNIVAPIYGGNNEVNLRAGDQTFNYLTKTVTSNNSAIPSEVAIDASALGKIQAGKIFIIATKEGFGIKYSADLLASRNGITIDAQGNIEYNNIASEAGDISVTSQKGSITQSGTSQTKNSANSITLNAFTNITNYGTITAGRDLTLEAKSITSFKELVAGRNLTLTAPQITNEDSIYANNKITIKATDFLTNNKDIISLGTTVEDGITITSGTTNNNKQIAAKKNVTINSESLNNNTANSLILALNNINLNVNSIDNSSANIQAKNNLTLRNLSSEIVSVTNIGGTFFAENLLDFDLGNSNYTIVGTLESAKDLRIKANNITNQTTLQSGGYIEITASDKFTNGALSADNSNTKIVSGTYLKITAQNLLSNYATLSSGTNLTLTSTVGNINNNIKAEIIGGIGLLTLSAKNGAVNQNSLNSLVSNGDLTLDVTDFVNTGRVDIAGDFTLNVSNNLINEETAMIYSGGDMELNVVNNLTNNSGAIIYAEGNLTIQKYALTNPLHDVADNKINYLLNNSGEIKSYAGNITIRATTLENSRAIDVVDLKPRTKDQENWEDDWTLIDDWCFGDGCGGGVKDYFASVTENTASTSAKIISGGSLTIETNDFQNLLSEIYATKDITINSSANGFTNSSETNLIGNVIYRDRFKANKQGWAKEYTEFLQPNFRYGKSNGVSFRLYVPTGYSTTTFRFGELYRSRVYGIASMPGYSYKTFNSYIKAGGSILGTAASKIDNDKVKQNEDMDVVKKEESELVDALDANVLNETGAINLNLTNYFSGPNNQGLFTKSTNPNGPLFETRSQFIDQSKFFGSDYFYTRIGLNLTDVQTQFELQNQRLVGDQFFQNKIIEEQLRTIAKNSLLLSKTEINVGNEIKTLLDNAADEYARLGLTANSTLTQAQINSLEKDIIWFETKIIDGSTYIVPTIYLAQNTRDNLKSGNIAKGSTIFANDNITLTSNGTLTNAGSIIANNISLNANSDIINKRFSDITALNDLSVTSTTGSIANFSNLKATNELTLTAAQDITNSATILTNAKNLLDTGNDAYVQNNRNSSNKGNIKSELIETAGITAGTLTINAGNDFNNYAANITTTGNAEITATNNINIETLQTRNRTEKYWGNSKNGGSKITDKTTNLQSEITSGENLVLTSNNDIILQSAKLVAEDNVDINAGNNLILVTSIDSAFSQTKTNSEGTFTFKNTDKGYTKTTVLNNEISSENSSDITFNVGNQALVQYNSKDWNHKIDSDPKAPTLAYLQDLKEQVSETNITFDVQKEINKSWDQTNRGLTQTSQLLIAVIAGVATGGLGSFATVGAGMLSAGLGAAATTATISGTSASMNGGGFGDTLKLTVTTAWKDTTNKDSLENIAIAAAAAGLTIGVTNAAGLNNVSSATTTSNSTTVTSTNFTTNAQRTLTTLGTSAAKVGISTGSYVVANSTIKGESLKESFKDQDGKLIAAQIIGEVGATEIGLLAHNDKISKPVQLTLHAGLGCGLSSMAGGNCSSGAIAGATSELVADYAFNNGSSAKDSILLGQSTGIATSLLASSLQNNSDEQTAKDIQLGSLIGANAAMYNATYVDKNGKVLQVTNEKDKDGNQDLGVYVDNQDGGTNKDKLLGQTEYWDEFIIPDSGSVATEAHIHFGKSIDLDINNLSNDGGAQVGGWNAKLERTMLAFDSRPGGKFDIKSQQKYGGSFDGYLLNDKYISMRSAGNYLAGVNAAKSGATWKNTIWAAGVLHQPLLLNRGAPYYGEIPYAGRRIESGFNSVTKTNK